MVRFGDLRVIEGEPNEAGREVFFAAKGFGDGSRVAGPGMGLGQHPSAQFAVFNKRLGIHVPDFERAFPVAEMAPIKLLAGGGCGPTKKNIAHGLHQPLAFDDPLPLVGRRIHAPMRGEHGWPGFLGLQHEDIIGRLAKEEADRAARAHRTDADGFEGGVGNAETREELTDLGADGREVSGEVFPDP